MKKYLIFLLLSGFLFAGSYTPPAGAPKGNPVFTGVVGIGNPNPLAKLDIAGGIRFGADVFASNIPQLYTTGSSGVVLSGVSGTNTDIVIAESGGIELFSNPSGTNNTVLNRHFGNTGVGQPAPTAKLQVSTSPTSGYGLGFAGAYMSLPTSGQVEGTMAYQVSDHKLYISTIAVTNSGCWKAVW